MKLGASTYSLSRAIKAKEMNVLDAITYIAEIGGYVKKEWQTL